MSQPVHSDRVCGFLLPCAQWAAHAGSASALPNAAPALARPTIYCMDLGAGMASLFASKLNIRARHQPCLRSYL